MLLAPLKIKLSRNYLNVRLLKPEQIEQSILIVHVRFVNANLVSQKRNPRKKAISLLHTQSRYMYLAGKFREGIIF